MNELEAHFNRVKNTVQDCNHDFTGWIGGYNEDDHEHTYCFKCGQIFYYVGMLKIYDPDHDEYYEYIDGSWYLVIR